MAKLARALLASVIAVVGAWPAVAAENQAGNEAGTPNVAVAETRASTDDGAESDNVPADAPDVFLPTEEISEDFAVPFPVDI